MSVHPVNLDDLGWFTGYDGVLYERRIQDVGEYKGEHTAYNHYPAAVLRDEQGIQGLAEYSFQTWFRSLKVHNERNKKSWDLSATEGKRLFVVAFVASYKAEVAERDKKAGKSSPAPSSVQGATLILKQVERNADEYVYYIELSDPGHIDGVQTAEIVYPLGEVEPAQAFASAGYAVSSSDSTPSYKAIVPLPSLEQTKGSRLYVRNVKKK